MASASGLENVIFRLTGSEKLHSKTEHRIFLCFFVLVHVEWKRRLKRIDVRVCVTFVRDAMDLKTSVFNRYCDGIKRLRSMILDWALERALVVLVNKNTAIKTNRKWKPLNYTRLRRRNNRLSFIIREWIKRVITILLLLRQTHCTGIHISVPNLWTTLWTYDCTLHSAEHCLRLISRF